MVARLSQCALILVNRTFPRPVRKGRCAEDMVQTPSQVFGKASRDAVIPERELFGVRVVLAKNIHEAPGPDSLVGQPFLGMKTDLSLQPFGIEHIQRLGRDIDVAYPDEGLIRLKPLLKPATQPGEKLQFDLEGRVCGVSALGDIRVHDPGGIELSCDEAGLLVGPPISESDRKSVV